MVKVAPVARNKRKSRLGLILPLFILAPAGKPVPGLDANAIIERSAEAIQADWNAAPQYNYVERDVEGHGSKTYQVLMILGSPYQRLLAVNGSTLSPEDQKKEQRKLDEATAQRGAESGEQREKRVADYQKERRRDHRMMEELTKAFVFKLSGSAVVNSHRVYVLSATPRPGYQPSDKETEVLTGMRGKLWIDKTTFQWVKVHAEVIHPVSIDGFLATVEPGTQFELDKAPVSDRIWLPSHFSMRSKAKIFSVIRHQGQQDQTFSNYRPAPPLR